MELNLHGENENKKAGMLLSIITHLLILLLLFVPLFKSHIIPPGQKGILVQFGSFDAGSDNIDPESAGTLDDASQEAEEETVEAEKEEIKSEPTTPASPAATDIKETVRDKNAEILAEQERIKQQEREAAELKKAEEEAAERKRLEEEARKQKEFDEKKKRFGDILSEGQSQGETAGERGDPKGDPDKSVLDNLAKGSGKVGGGLSNRGVEFEPKIQENSQKSGTVVIEICVNTSGEVVSAKYTQRGSTTTEKSLVDVALSGARKYRFSASEIEKQCGTVTINFIVK